MTFHGRFSCSFPYKMLLEKIYGCWVQSLRGRLGAKYAVVGCKVYGDVWVHVYAFWVHVYGSVGCMYADVGCKSAETFGCKVCGCWVQVS